MPGSADETGAAGCRPVLFSIARGMTGSVGDAGDVVEDAFPGLTRARQAGTTITEGVPDDGRDTAGNQLPAFGAGGDVPGGLAARAGGRPRGRAGVGRARRAGRLAVDRVPGAARAFSRAERAVFMLREVFGYRHPEAARIAGKTDVNCLQIFVAPAASGAAGGRRGTARRFSETADGGDMDAPLGVLAPEVVFHADGGGKAQAISAPRHGRERLAWLLADLFRRGRHLGRNGPAGSPSRAGPVFHRRGNAVTPTVSRHPWFTACYPEGLGVIRAGGCTSELLIRRRSSPSQATARLLTEAESARAARALAPKYPIRPGLLSPRIHHARLADGATRTPRPAATDSRPSRRN